jgi:hypothetical protein
MTGLSRPDRSSKLPVLIACADPRPGGMLVCGLREPPPRIADESLIRRDRHLSREILPRSGPNRYRYRVHCLMSRNSSGAARSAIIPAADVHRQQISQSQYICQASLEDVSDSIPVAAIALQFKRRFDGTTRVPGLACLNDRILQIRSRGLDR